MSKPFSFSVPEATEKRLDRYLEAIHPRPHSWKRYIDADTHDHMPPDDEPRLWPCVFNPFLEWFQRNEGLAQLLRETINRHNQSDQTEKLNALITAVEQAFEDFPIIWAWATDHDVWTHDPEIRAHFTGNGGNGEMEEADPRMIEVDENAVCTHFPGPGGFTVNVM